VECSLHQATAVPFDAGFSDWVMLVQFISHAATSPELSRAAEHEVQKYCD